MPFTYGCTTPITALAAIAASMAFPPCSRMCAPACDARNCGAATMPNLVTTIDRPCPGTEANCGCCATTAGARERDTAAARARSFIPFLPLCGTFCGFGSKNHQACLLRRLGTLREEGLSKRDS